MSKTVILKAGLVLYGENNALIKSLLVDNESRSELINKNASQKKKWVNGNESSLRLDGTLPLLADPPQTISRRTVLFLYKIRE